MELLDAMPNQYRFNSFVILRKPNWGKSNHRWDFWEAQLLASDIITIELLV